MRIKDATKSTWDDRGLELILQKLLEIAGEAFNRANQAEPKAMATVPDLRLYIDLRNRLTHGYDSVDYSVVWRAALEEIPPLRSKLDAMLADAPPLADL